MLTLPLEPTDDLANPAFKSAASCTLWLRQLQLTNLQLAHQQLLIQVNELNRYPMRGIDRLSTLEALRETVDHVQKSYANKLIARPLPFNQTELFVFVSILKLWQAMSLGYQRCLQDQLAEDHDLDAQVALLCQRCMLYNGSVIFEHLRAGYEFDGALWQQIHQLYAFAEANKLQLEEVSASPLMDNQPNSSCHRIYLKILLACYAHPSELGRTQLQLLDNWLSEWSKEIFVEQGFVHAKTQRLATDMSGAQGLQSAQNISPGDSVRYLAISPISKLLKVHIILLEQGKSPQYLKLGDCSGKDGIKFLTFLHQCWCENRNLRAVERQRVSRHAQLCYQAEHIYAQVRGEPFRPPVQTGVSNALALKHAGTLRMKAALKQEPPIQLLPLEIWHIENESIMGAQLTRESVQGERIILNQLAAIRLAEDAQCVLAATAWLSVLRTGQLRMGIRYLPGTVQAVSIRAKDASEKYEPAFLLGTTANLKVPSSLIIPRNWFQPNRVIDIVMQNGEQRKIKLGFSVERGVDYERVSFSFV